MTSIRLKLGAAVSALLLASCATAGKIAPNISTLSSEKAPIISTAEQTDYSALSEEGKGLATASSRGELNELTLNMPGVERELNALLDAIAAKWPHDTPNRPTVKVALGGQYHAVTFPDGVIAVNVGALGPLSGSAAEFGEVQAGYVMTDQELTYLLSHEFSHYALGHHNKADFFSSSRNSMKTLAKYYNTASALSRMKYQGDAQNGQVVIEDQQGLNKDIDATVALVAQADSIQRSMLSPAWNRGQEDKADGLAIDLMWAMDQKSELYGEVFDKLQRQEKLTQSLMKAISTSLTQSQEELMSTESFEQMLDGNSDAVGKGIFQGFTKGVQNMGRDVRSTPMQWNYEGKKLARNWTPR